MMDPIKMKRYLREVYFQSSTSNDAVDCLVDILYDDDPIERIHTLREEFESAKMADEATYSDEPFEEEEEI